MTKRVTWHTDVHLCNRCPNVLSGPWGAYAEGDPVDVRCGAAGGRHVATVPARKGREVEIPGWCPLPDAPPDAAEEG